MITDKHITNENIGGYLDYCIEKGTLYEVDKLKLLYMYDNLVTYKYDEIFNKSQTLFTLNLSCQSLNNKPLLGYLNEETIYKCTSISNDNETIHKIYVLHNDNKFKSLFLINYIREVYFQQLCYSLLHNIKDNTQLIIPNILRYGLVNKDEQIYFFFEMPYYKRESIECSITPNIHDCNVKYEYIRLLNNCKNITRSLELIGIFENNNIFHNDIHIDRGTINNYINHLLTYNIHDEFDDKLFYTDFIKEYHKNRIDLHDDNLFVFNDNTCILIDFEKAYRLSNRRTTTCIFSYIQQQNTI